MSSQQDRRRNLGKRDTAELESYRAIFDAANDAFFVHDLNTGQILTTNRKMTELYGYSPDEARQLDVAALSADTPPYTQKEALFHLRKAAREARRRFSIGSPRTRPDAYSGSR